MDFFPLVMNVDKRNAEWLGVALLPAATEGSGPERDVRVANHNAHCAQEEVKPGLGPRWPGCLTTALYCLEASRGSLWRESNDESCKVIKSVVLQNQINSLFCEMETPTGPRPAGLWCSGLPIHQHPSGLSREGSPHRLPHR